ncbi:type I polyketide synthase [Streptomyces johnsoniae]|uniref:Beta-ketoacyl synthase N-terminal-like domain-containing protein n=1 Tax=Streptomyces johnsoniae TaxID=3075532 RepID=A0ABU2RXQ8_9ACTN|nr:polyketide synthase [Streptomyces sp. DSM 41886]MDT0441397.1 beta-ketoacyl synthase N-terminal-like domain-containing protein [Streptomyces sp. DSM 41886]
MRSDGDQAVAIVGAGCRFPGGGSGPEGLWRLLLRGTDVITEVPRSRWDLERYYDPDPDTPGTMYTRWGGFLPDIERFDAAFFGIAPREARQMDPQQRLLLEVAWEALEDAGIRPGDLSGTRTSVFTGGLGVDYFLAHARDAGLAGIDPWYATGKESSFTSGRLSYLLGLNGPSLSLNTACSSSLVAVHLARQSLLTGESDAALVGGVNLLLSPELTVFMCKAGAMAPDGRCKVFDAGANGIVRGDGCAVLVLKRLDDALADGDDVLAVIRGSAVNHDGQSAGLTVPSATAQQRLITDALAAARLHPHDVGYVEAHGTGTPLGDPIEVWALGDVLARGRSAEDPLVIGSVKANLGHTDGAAGITGLLKAALVVRHGRIPPHLHLKEPNPNIAWDQWPLRVPTEGPVDWPGPAGRPRIAGVSAFGLSGSNAHVLVESPPERAAAPAPAARAGGTDGRAGGTDGRTFVLPLSARSAAALRDLAAAHRDRLGGQEAAEREGADGFADVASFVRTAAVRRTHHAEHRLAVTGGSAAELAAELDAFTEQAQAPVVGERAGPGGVCFVFSGQGGQWAGMGLRLRAAEPAFREALDRCDALIREAAGWSVVEELSADGDASRLADTEIAQPVVFAVQVALAALWRSWGVEPSAVVGHSMGEIAAAHVAGALDLADAVRIAVLRGRLLQRAAGQGLMAAVALPEEETERRLAPYGERLCVAAANAQGSTVVAGEPDAVEEFTAALKAEGLTCRTLPGGYAFHSPQMAPFEPELVGLLDGLAPREPRVRIVTTTPGDGRFDAAHWGRNVRRPVRFAGAVAELLDAGHRTFVELGPHPVLAQPLTQSLEAAGLDGTVVPSLRRDTDDVDTARASLAALFTAGADVAWDAVAPAGEGVDKRLPRYAWQGERLWFETPRAAGPDAQVAAGGLAALHGELRLYDAAGRVVAEATGLRLGAPGDGATAAAAGPGAPAVPAVPAVSAAVEAAGHRPDPAELADLVARKAAAVLGLPQGGTPARTQGFTELGMDSLGTVELARQLQQALGVRVPKTAALDHPTVERLAAYLDTRLAAAPAARAQAPAAVPAPGPVAAEVTGPEPIAVIGLGCRFPGGASGPDAYWRMLRAGTDAIRPAPEGRFGGSRVWHGGFMEGVDEFDAPFFRIPPREARVMDPQQRMFLEVAWEALEHAGQPPAALAGTRTGVFLGMNSTDYAGIVTAHPGNVDAFYGTGNSFTAAAGRLSYLLGVHGPSLAVDTACSSSLVAVHLAVASLRSGESELAVAGGVNLILSDVIHRSTSAMGALAADGRCKTFDASADGYTRGEGCGVVVLKPLSAARADGDDVLAVLLGSAVNQDGPSGGLTVPNGPAQEDLLRRALADAGVAPGEVGYVEAHGTGTPLGDPIELQALGAVLGERDGSCLVGSVKTNVGHLEAASGVAGLIKTVLALHHREIPPHLHFTEPSPDIPWDELPLAVPVEPTPWAPGAARRVAGVSAFGFSGTNAHVVLAEPPADAGAAPVRGAAPGGADAGERRVHALPLSAAGRNALLAQADAWGALLSGGEDDAAPALEDLAYTAALRRTHLEHRVVVVGDDRRQLAERLAAFGRGEDVPGVAAGQAGAEPRRGPVFVFSGHGSFWRGMCRDLLRESPVFREAIERCDRALRPHLDWSIAEVLAQGQEPAAELDQQFLLFGVQYALTQVWRGLGVEPAAVTGHSMGEVSAALCAGALDLGQAVEVMVHRTEVLKDLMGRGGMAVVGLDAERTAEELAGYEDRLCVSIVNSHRSTVISGETAALEEVGARLKARNVFFRPVAAGAPAHSPVAEPMRGELVARLAGLRPAEPVVPIYSSVTGGPVDGPLDAEFWGRNLRHTVWYADAVRALAADGHTTFVELSPHPLQLAPTEHELDAAGIADRLLVPSLTRESDGPVALMTAFGTLHAAGRPVGWERLHPAGGRLAAAPRYPWQHKRYWVEHEAASSGAAPAFGGAAGGGARHPLLARELRAAGGPRTRIVEADVDAELAAGTGAEPVGGHLRLPAAAWLEMALAAVAGDGGRVRRLEDVSLPGSCLTDPAVGSVAQLTLTPEPGGAFAFTVHARAAGDGEGGGEGPARPLAAGRAVPGSGSAAPDAVPASGMRGAPDARVTEWFAARGGGGALRAVSAVRGADAVEVEVECAPAALRWRMRPDVLDAALRLPALLGNADEAARDVLPRHIASAAVYGTPGQRLLIGARRTPGADGELCADVWVATPEGTLIAEARGVRLAPPPGRLLDAAELRSVADSFYRVDWHERPHEAAEPLEAAGGWLLLADGGGVAQALAGLLEERGGTVEVLAGAREEAEVTAALRALHRGPGCRGVVHLAALDLPAGVPAADRIAAAAAVAASVPAVAAAAQAVTGAAGPARVHYVTRGAVTVGAGEPPAPLHAPVHRLAGVTGVERPTVWGGVTDLDPFGDGPARDASWLLAELLAPDGEDHLAVRAGRRLGARIVRCAEPEPVLVPPALRADRTYLVAGDDGGLAERLAAWLTERGAGRVVAAGRLADPGTARDTAGALVKEAEQAGAPLAGVVWAGTEWNLSPQGAAPPAADEVGGLLAERAAGAWLLHDVCAEADLELDLFAVFTSVAALWGAAGAGHQAAPDALLSALAAHRQALGLPACELAWAPWDGVGRLDENSRSLLVRSGLEPLSPESGTRLLDHALAGAHDAVAVAAVDWSLLLPLYQQSLRWPLFDEIAASALAAPDGTDELLARLAALPPTERDELLLDLVLAEVAVVLGMDGADDLEPRQGFFEIGVSSITAVELRIRLERRFACALPATLAFEQPTAEAVARYLAADVLGLPAADAPGSGSEPEPEPEPEVRPATEPRPESAGDGDDLLALLDEQISAVNDLLDKGAF